MRIKRLLIVLIFLLITTPVFGAAHYANLNDSGSTGAGTFAEPFKTKAEIDGHAWTTGDDLYFSSTGTHTLTGRLLIDWTGSVGDGTVIGCYDGDADFDCGASYGTISGGGTVPAGTHPVYQGLIEFATAGQEYITVQELEIKDSNAGGIRFYHSAGQNNITVNDCYIDSSDMQAINFIEVDTGSITNNIIVDCATGSVVPLQPAIGLYGNWSDGSMTDVTVSGNKLIRSGGEGIGFYTSAGPNLIAEKNVLIDTGSYVLYNGSGSHDNIFRYNLIYYTPARSWVGNDVGIVFSCEGWTCDGEIQGSSNKCSDDNQAYGNLIAAANSGINFSAATACNTAGLNPKNNLVYNNTIVDSLSTNFSFTRVGTGNLIKNNISWILDGGGGHVSTCSPAGVTFDYNLWDSDPGTGNCDAANDPANASLELSKASGWQSLVSDAVAGSEFEPTSSSPAIDGTALDLGTSLEYVLIPGTCDFTATPITCTAADADDYVWPYGAFLGGLTISAGFPTSLLECGTTQTFGVTSSANATCRFSVKGADTCATAYLDLDEEFENTGARTAHTDTDETFACDNTDTLVVICNDGSYDSNCLEITVDVAPASGNPQPPPTGFGGGGNVSSGGGGTVTAGSQ